MNINFGIFSSYVKAQEYGNYAKNAKMPDEKTFGKKQDTVCISADAAAYRQIGSATKTVASEIEQEGSTKIDALRTAIQNGSYSVSAGEVADAILSRMI